MSTSGPTIREITDDKDINPDAVEQRKLEVDDDDLDDVSACGSIKN